MGDSSGKECGQMITTTVKFHVRIKKNKASSAAFLSPFYLVPLGTFAK